MPDFWSLGMLSRKTFLLFLLTVTPFIFISKTLFLKDPPVWPDEAIFADTALNLSETGVMKTGLFGEDFFGLHEHALWYPPFYFYLLSAWIRVNSASIESLRSLSVLASFISLFVLFKTFHLIFNKALFSFLALLLVSTDLYFNLSSRTARMDIINFVFINLCLYFVILALYKNPKRNFFLAGIFSGLALVTHPYGLIAPVTACLSLFLQKKPIRIKATFGTVYILGLLPAVIWWLSIIINYRQIFLEQYYLQFARKSLAQLDFTWSAINISYFISLSAFFILPFIILGKEFWFLLYFQPWGGLIVVFLLSYFYKIRQRLGIFAVVIIYSVILVFNMAYYFDGKMAESWGKADYTGFAKTIGRMIPDGARVFLAAKPDPYFVLAKNKSLSFYEFPTVPVTRDKYLQLLDECDYIVFNMGELEIVDEYINVNARRIVTVRGKDGYSAQVIQLKERNDRKNI